MGACVFQAVLREQRLAYLSDPNTTPAAVLADVQRVRQLADSVAAAAAP